MPQILKQPIASVIATIMRSRLGVGNVVMLLVFHLSGTSVEVIGLFSLLPVFQFLQSGGNVSSLIAEHRTWQVLSDAYAWAGLPLRLETLLITSFTFLMLRQAVVFARLRFTARVLQSATARIRLEIFSGFLAATIEAQERDSVGVVVNDMTIEVQRALQYVLSLVTSFGYLTLLTIYTVTLLILSPIMTGVALLTFGAAYLLIRPQVRRSAEVGALVTQANQRLSVFVVGRLNQMRLVRLAGMQRAEFNAMKVLVDKQRAAMTRVAYLLANVEVIIEPVVVATGFIFLFVAVSILNLPLAQVGLFLVILIRLLPVVKESSRVHQSIKSTHAGYTAVMRRITDFANAAEKTERGGRPFTGLVEGIHLEAVTFTYPDAPTPAIANISVSFPAHQMSALVGPSGAGKSTLIDLLPRLRRPSAGRVVFDNVPQEQLDVVALRNGIAFVPQSPEMFNVTVAEHIRYGKIDATEEQIRNAAGLAQAEDFIERLPDGYNTLIGEGGGLLSGGQRQRLDLARALVRRAPILILDEPTSSLDGESEDRFLKALQRIRSETRMTLIVIAHRLSTVAIADQIVIMDAGRIRAVGRHDELIVRDAWYRKVFEIQQSARDVGFVIAG